MVSIENFYGIKYTVLSLKPLVTSSVEQNKVYLIESRVWQLYFDTPYKNIFHNL